MARRRRRPVPGPALDQPAPIEQMNAMIERNILGNWPPPYAEMVPPQTEPVINGVATFPQPRRGDMIQVRMPPMYQAIMRKEEDLAKPILKAEALLREALPEELYLALCALDKFEITGKSGNRYEMSKKVKTIITTSTSRRYSACIQLPPECPAADRVLAEYILVKSNEPEYLATANLFEMRDEWNSGVAMRQAYIPMHERPVRNNVHCHEILERFVRFLRDILGNRLRGLRDRALRPGLQSEQLGIDVVPDIVHFPMAEIDHRMRDYAYEMAMAISERRVAGFQQLPLPRGIDMAARTTDEETGLSVRFCRAYDIGRNDYMCRLDMDLLIRDREEPIQHRFDPERRQRYTPWG